MKFLHAADLHLGNLSHSRIGPDGIPTAYASQARCLEAIADAAEEHDVDAVVIAGDVFHHANPDAWSITTFAEFLRMIPVPVLIVAGNHDRAPRPGYPSILEAFASPRLEVYVSTTPETHQIDGVRFATLPHVSRARLAAGIGGSREATEDAMVDLLEHVIDGFRHDADVLVGHWSVQGATLGNERDISVVSEPILPLHAMDGFAYVAFGHIHAAQNIGTFGMYAGSMDRVSFSEESEPKSVLVLETDGDDAEIVDEIFLPARRFLTIEGSGPETPAARDIDGAIVRVRGVVPELVEEFRSACVGDGADVVYVEPVVPDRVAPRIPALEDTPGPLDALEKWMDAKFIDEDERPAVREVAKEMIERG